nr:uncharacterized protein LOC113820853 [Penaeus vannamei]
MLVLMVGVVLTAALAIAFVCSAFILFIILTSKQVRRVKGLDAAALQGPSLAPQEAHVKQRTRAPTPAQIDWALGTLAGASKQPQAHNSNKLQEQHEPPPPAAYGNGRLTVPPLHRLLHALASQGYILCMIRHCIVSVSKRTTVRPPNDSILLQERWLLHDSQEAGEGASAEELPQGDDWDAFPLNATDGVNVSYDSLASVAGASWLPSHDAENLSAVLSLGLNDSAGGPLHPVVWESDVVCRMYGFLLVMLHTVAVWVVVGLHCDKYCAIATPLRYNQIVTRRRVAALSSIAWVMGLVLATPPLLGSYAYSFSEGVCLPVWHLADAAAYTWTLATLYVILPFTIMLIVNGRIIVIARHHQHRIFSAIFEVMMSAQATVTHQKNPFDVPKKKRKSVWTVLEQLAAFVVCYYPFFGTIMWETIRGRPANEYCVLFVTALFVLSPLVNTFVYGIKSKNIRKAFRNYLRKKLYKTEMKHEIQARIPSASNSRRPSITSTLAMPILQKSLQRRMSDYLLQDQLNQPKLVRRSSDMSWHPLEEGTPSPTRLRRPLDTKFPVQSSPAGSHSPASVANFLTVPSFEAARNYYCSQQRVRLSISSLDSDQSFSVRESRTEEENLMVTLSPDSQSTVEVLANPHEASESISRSKSLQLPLFTLETKDPKEQQYQAIHNQTDCQTPLLCKTFEKPNRSSSLHSSSPHVMRTLEAILSVRISQSLLRRGSGWGGSQGSMERLSQFLRENRRNTLPANDSYAPFTLHNADSEDYPEENNLGSPPANMEDEDVSVLTFITPLPNGGACLGVCPKDAPLEMETTLTVT